MKNLFIVMLLLVGFGLMTNSCKKDKEDTKNNYFTYNNTDFQLTGGYIENYGKFSGTDYNLDLTLISSGITTHTNNGNYISLTGTGHAIHFEMYTSDSTKLSVRDYNFDDNATELAGTFDYGAVVMNYNFDTENGDFFVFTAGKVTIKNNGSEYEITYECTSEDGKTITGSYKGPIAYYNTSGKK
jgi:hypothetical protein